MQRVFICDYIRTPIGRYGGALSGVRPDDLAAHLDLAGHLTTRIADPRLKELTDRLPGLAETVGAGIMLATVCEIRTMQPCAYAEIESWAKGAGRRGRPEIGRAQV